MVATAVMSLGVSAVAIMKLSAQVAGVRTWVLADDEMISMTYARNLAQGAGLVWNAGGERVEGYSNFLWTVWLAFIHLFGISDAKTSLLVLISGAVILCGTTVTVHALATAISGDRVAAAVAAAFTALSYALVYWVMRGFEVGLASLALVAATLFAVRLRRSGGGLSAALFAAALVVAVLTRDDLVVPSAALLAALAFRPEASTRRAIAAAGAVVGAVAVAHIMLRLAYYGDPLPNTYYLKVEGTPLRVRFSRGAQALAGTTLLQLSVPLVFGVVALYAPRGRRWPHLDLVVAPIVAVAAYSVYVGGDAWELFQIPNRYVATVLPLIGVVAAAGITQVVDRRRSAAAAVLGLALAVGFAAWPLGAALPEQVDVPDWGPSPTRLERLVPIEVWRMLLVAGVLVAVVAAAVMIRKSGRVIAVTLVGASVLVAASGEQAVKAGGMSRLYADVDVGLASTGVAVRSLTYPDQSIAVVHAGSIPYFARRSAVDELGKSDRVIARLSPRPDRPFIPGHTKFDITYSIGRLRPDVIVELPVAGKVEDVARRWGYELRDRGDPRVRVLVPEGGVLVRAEERLRNPAR